MSPHAQLVFAVGVAGLMATGVAIFMGWLVWSLVWDLYDHLMQQRTRKRLRHFDARVGRDCWTDKKGLTR